MMPLKWDITGCGCSAVRKMNETKKCLYSTSRRKVLEELIKNEEGISPYQIAKEVGISDSSVNRHLEILSDAGFVYPPETDISGGRLKKIYKPTSRAKNAIEEFWDKEIQSAPNVIRNKYLEDERK